MSSSSAAPWNPALLEELRPPPLGPASFNNRGPYIFLTALATFLIACLAAFAKLSTDISTYRTLQYNDIALLAGMLFAFGYTTAICEGAKDGLGTAVDHLRPGQTVTELSQAFYASNILLYLALACAKCSTALLVLGLKPPRWIVLALYGILAATSVWVVAAVFVVAFQCGPTRWVLGPTAHDSCIDQYSAQIGLRVVDMITDVGLSLLPAALVAGVQMSTYKKWVVSFMFGLRLATPALTAVSLATQAEFYNASPLNRPHAVTTPAIWNSVALNVSLITACLPSIKRFLTDMGAGVMNAGMRDPFELQNSSGKTYGTRGFTKRSKLGSSSIGKPVPNTVTDQSYSGYVHTGSLKRGEDVVVDDGDSKKGLVTDGILQTTDYRIEYEHNEPDRARRRPREM